MGRGAANGVFALINVNVFLFIIGLRCFNDIFNTNKSTWRVMFRWAYHGILSHIRMNRGNQTFLWLMFVRVDGHTHKLAFLHTL